MHSKVVKIRPCSFRPTTYRLTPSCSSESVSSAADLTENQQISHVLFCLSVWAATISQSEENYFLTVLMIDRLYLLIVGVFLRQECQAFVG